MFLQDLEVILASPSVLLIMLLALAFAFSNGFHDAANSITTVVGARALKPRQAVLWATFWNLAAAAIGGVAIANTVAKWVLPEWITVEVVAGGVAGALGWNLITWAKGLPTSSSHALLGGFAGAAMAHAGSFAGVLKMDKLLLVLLWLFIAPIIGMVLAALLSRLVRVIAGPPKLEGTQTSRTVRLFTSAAYSFGHGTNDAQKTMGIIAALLYATVWKAQQAEFVSGHSSFPFWIVLVCHVAIALGTWAGGWRIINAMTYKITDDLTTHGGVCAETAAASALLAAYLSGAPISTTHAFAGGLVGVGVENRPSATAFWNMVKTIIKAWFLTVPGAALIGALVYGIITLFAG